MNIDSDVTSGIAPLEVNFWIDGIMVSIVKWLWLFGDGSQSTEPSPKHIYMAPGIYSVTVTVWDEYGNSYTLTNIDYIYVYDFNIGVTGLISGTTDFCFKHAIKALQGQGIMPIGGRWVWPPIVVGTAKGVSENHENISLVLNAETMEFFQIGIPELWTDRKGTYEESEIECEAFLPKIKSRYGEHENVRHVETHVSMRSWDEKRYRGKAGYTKDGFRNNHSLSIEIYEDGEQIIPATKLMEVIRKGDYAFLKEVEARTLQEKLKYTTSAFRTTTVEVHCQEIDHRTPPQLNDIPEKIYQREFYSPDIWFSKNKPSINTNRADGTEWNGIGTSTTGPDKKTSAFNSILGLSGVVAYTISDFMISGWMIGDGILFRSQIQGGGNVVVEVVADVLRFDDGTNVVEFPMLSSIIWRHLSIVRKGNKILLYEGGLLRISHSLNTFLIYGGNATIGIGTCFDIRRYSKAISGDALYYYYESVKDGGGGFLP